METTHQPNIQQELPNATLVLVFGILSIVFCFCYGFLGLVFGILSVVLASKANKLYKSSPQNYTIGSYNNVKAGKVCGIIGLCLSGIFFLLILAYLAFFGFVFTSVLPWSDMMQQPY